MIVTTLIAPRLRRAVRLPRALAHRALTRLVARNEARGILRERNETVARAKAPKVTVGQGGIGTRPDARNTPGTAEVPAEEVAPGAVRVARAVGILAENGPAAVSTPGAVGVLVANGLAVVSAPRAGNARTGKVSARVRGPRAARRGRALGVPPTLAGQEKRQLGEGPVSAVTGVVRTSSIRVRGWPPVLMSHPLPKSSMNRCCRQR